jgi:hypothetical protein
MEIKEFSYHSERQLSSMRITLGAMDLYCKVSRSYYQLQVRRVLAKWSETDMFSISYQRTITTTTLVSKTSCFFNAAGRFQSSIVGYFYVELNYDTDNEASLVGFLHLAR